MVRLQVLYFLVVSAVATNATIKVVRPEKTGPRYLFLPDGTGKLHLVDFHKEYVLPKFTPADSVRYYLHTKGNPVIVVKNGDANSLTGGFYDPRKPIKIYAHGWLGEGSSQRFPSDHTVWSGGEVNLFLVDWEKGASSSLFPVAVDNMVKVAIYTAQFVDWLVSLGAPLSNIQLIGHSLGGQMVGIAGRHVSSGKVPYLLALDPAYELGIGYNGMRIRTTDGEYVEIMHTSVYSGGNFGPFGHADFYPHKGVDQPGCLTINPTCSHMRAIDLMVYSIGNKKFRAKQCTTYLEMYYGLCANLSETHMAGWDKKPARGIFYLETTRSPPYHKE